MKKRFFIWIFAFAMILPSAIILSACGGKKNTPQVNEIGISVYIDGLIVNNQNNTINITYGEFDNATNMINSKIAVNLNFDNNTSQSLNYGAEGFSVLGLPNNLNANEQGYELNLTYKSYSQDLKLVIHKANIDLMSVEWNYNKNTPFTYDGEEKSVELIGIPEGVNPNYENNIGTNAGTYLASVEFEYDSANCYITNAPENLVWKINKAENTISGEIVINSINYGENFIDPNGLTAVHGAITYKYYTYDGSQYTEIDKPTNVGTYYVKGYSVGDDNWISNSTDYKEFSISRCYLDIPELTKSTFIYNGTEFNPQTINEIDTNLIEISGVLSATDIGNYTIIYALKDKINYCWKDSNDTQQNTDDIELNWAILNSPITLNINNNLIPTNEIESLNIINISDSWSFTIADDNYTAQIKCTYLDIKTNKIITETLNENAYTVRYNDYSYTIDIYSNNSMVYTKTLNVNHNVIEKIIVGTEEKTYQEFIENPIVNYGENISIQLTQTYENKFTFSQNDFVVTHNIEVTLYHKGEIYKIIQIICNTEVLTNISLNNKIITYGDFKNNTNIGVLYNSTFSFDVNPEFNGIYKIYTTLNAQPEIQHTGTFTYTFNNINDNLHLIVEDEFYNRTYYYFQVIVFDSVTINNNNFKLNQKNLTYELDKDENSFAILLNEDIINNYDLYYSTSIDDNPKKLNQSTINLLASEIGECLDIQLLIGDNNYNGVLTICFSEFTPIDKVVVTSTSPLDENIHEVDGNQESLLLTNIFGIITNFEIEFKEDYKNCTYKILDPAGNEISNFIKIQSGNYTIKVYSNQEEIYSTLIHIAYNFDFLFNGMQYVQESDIPVLKVTENILTKTFEDTLYFTLQSITFNGQSSLTLNEGKNEVLVVYNATVGGFEYTYKFKLFVEYIVEEQTNYINSITIYYNNGNSLNLYDNEIILDSYIALYDLARIKSSDIEINVKQDVTVLSKEIIIDKNNNNLAYLQYTLSTLDGNKSYRIYLNTYDKISNNINAEFVFYDEINSNINITDLILNDEYIIEKLNISGNIEIIPEDENIEIKQYFNDELLETYDPKYINLEKVGKYTIEIISSDNTVSRIINIYVQDIESLIFEVFYNGERLYLENGEFGPVGNVKMAVGDNGPLFIGYFGETNLEDVDMVTLSGNSMFKDMIYMPDMITPITDLNNIELMLQTDDDGSITKVVGAKYVLIYINVEINRYIPIYFVFADNPPYPMTFNFDTNNNNEIDENDTQLSLKVNLQEIDIGAIDLGDFVIGNNGPSIELTREELGMADAETSVKAIVNWSSTFDDYSYQYFTNLPEGQNMPELIGPSEENLSSTLNLNFIDNGSGVYVATIYICTEGATLENIYDYILPVEFVLVN